MSSLYTNFVNQLKPCRPRALQCVRVNTMALITGIIVSYLLPIPSLHEAIYVLHARRYDPEALLYRRFCIFEVALLSLFLFNILCGIYAVRFPRTFSLPGTPLAKPPVAKENPITPKRDYNILPPREGPQPQKPFSFSPASSFGRSMSSQYPSSPFSTPSRSLVYTMPSKARLLSSHMHSSQLPSSSSRSSPSPAVNAYRMTHPSRSVGHALDGAFLERLKRA